MFITVKGGSEMKVGFPVEKDEGLNSRIFGHFGSAPCFIVVGENDKLEVVKNEDAERERGNCAPISALKGVGVDVLVVGGIGSGALDELAALNIRVYGAEARTAGENLEKLRQKKLNTFDRTQTCSGHLQGCSHG